MGLNLTIPESGKNIACVGQKINKFDCKEVHIGPTQNCFKKLKKKHGTQFGLICPLGLTCSKS